MKTLIVGPHPDDELLGCGGALLRRKSQGVEVGWLLMTSLSISDEWPEERILKRTSEIEKVRIGLGVSANNFFNLDFPAMGLDRVPTSILVEKISSVIKLFQPEEIFLPHPGDIHSDHRITFEAAVACSKWFRYPTIRRVLTYETLSETNFDLDPRYNCFRPNVYENIEDYLDVKLELLNIYDSEIGAFPFPRSVESLMALAKLRGSEAGFRAAEGFCLLRERQ